MCENFLLGFQESDFADGGSDRLVAEVIAMGNETEIRSRIEAHLEAGASHVCIEPIDTSDPKRTDLRAFEILAP